MIHTLSPSLSQESNMITLKGLGVAVALTTAFTLVMAVSYGTHINFIQWW